MEENKNITVGEIRDFFSDQANVKTFNKEFVITNIKVTHFDRIAYILFYDSNDFNECKRNYKDIVRANIKDETFDSNAKRKFLLNYNSNDDEEYISKYQSVIKNTVDKNTTFEYKVFEKINNNLKHINNKWGLRLSDRFEEQFIIFREMYLKARKNRGVIMSKEDKGLEKFKKSIEAKLLSQKNIILHGAPGTGKSYMAKEIAENIIGEDHIKGQFEFVQFHPSYDYTDFVEGLRPDDDGSKEIKFKLKSGTFKRFCEKAVGIYTHLLNSNIWCVHLGNIKQTKIKKHCFEKGEIRIGWGNGTENKQQKKMLDYFTKTMKVDDFVLIFNDSNNIDGIGIVSGDYVKEEDENAKALKDFPYKRKVKWIQTGIKENFSEIYGSNLDQNTIYPFSLEKLNVDKLFDLINKYNRTSIELLSKNTRDMIKDRKHIFLIDEINRGEISKIFGELFFSIDPGYRGEKGRVKTQYSNLQDNSNLFKDGFYVPENVYIIATMNDIDRSVDDFDFAMRRRFAFIEVVANDTIVILDHLLKEKHIKNDDVEQVKNKMTNLNNKIEKIEGLSRDYHIGASYFLKLRDLKDVNGKVDFKALWDYYIEPLLRSYLKGVMDSDELDEQIKILKEVYDND